MLLRSLLPALLGMLVLASPAHAQLASGYLASVTSNVSVVAPASAPATLTATVKTRDGSPVSTLDGMLVDFTPSLKVPVKNGGAQTQIGSNISSSPITLFVSFPDGVSPTAGGSQIEITIEQRTQPLFTALSGDYVFSLHSYTGNGSVRGGEGVSIGVLHFLDAAGEPNITGEIDYNGALGSFQALPVTGTYTLDGNGFGKVTLQSSAGAQHFNLTVQVNQLVFLGRATGATLVEADTPRLAGAGMLYARNVFNAPQTSGPPPKTDLSGALVQLAGQADTGTAFPLPVSLTLNKNGSVAPDTVDLVAGAYVQQAVPAVVTEASTADTFGRFTFTITVNNQLAQQPSNYVGYGIDDSRVLLLSTDPAASKIVLSGEATVPPEQNAPGG